MTAAALNVSLGLWQRRERYRRRKLDKTRRMAHAHGGVVGGEAAAIHKWERLLRHASWMVDRRERQLATIGPRAIKIVGDKVTGGSERQRLVHAAHRAADLYSTGRRPSFYAQKGAWDVGHGITGEKHGYRSDCSQWVTAMFHSAGLDDPNGQNYSGGYTGTLGGSGKYIDRAHLKPGDLVLYGPAPHHHVELYVGPGDATIGHGDAAVNKGSITMMADVHFSRPKGLS